MTETIRLSVIGKPFKNPKRRCGCFYDEQAGGSHMGRGVWWLTYLVTPCKKHDGRRDPAREKKG